MSFEKKNLGEICDFQGGSQPPKSAFVYEPKEGYIRFLQIRDFGSEKNHTYIPISKKNKTCSADDIMIGRYGASVGKILRGRGGAYNVALMKATPVVNLINKHFFWYYLNSAIFQDDLRSVASRSAQNGFSKDDIFNFKVPLPPLATQQKIVAKLDAVFAEIDKATAAAEANAGNAEALFQSYLTDVFERGGEGWETLSIQELFKIRSGDFLPAKNMNNEGVIDVYGGNGISGKHNLHNLSGDNIIIGRVGAKCGNVRMITGDIWITDNAFYVSEYKRDINKEFLSVALEHKDLRKLANQMAQPVISFTTIKNAELKIPTSLSKQSEFLKIKNAIQLQSQIVTSSQTKKIDLLLLLKQAILKQAFNGKLVKE